MGAANSKDYTLTSWDLEMIVISWSFIKDKQYFGLNTMAKYIYIYI